MCGMFDGCNEIESIDLSGFDTSNVIDMGCLFSECHKLKEIKGIDKFNTSKVKGMRGMFNNCHELETIDLSGFDTSNAIDMECMFNGCNKLKKIISIENLIHRKLQQ